MDTTAADLQRPLKGVQGENQKLGTRSVFWKKLEEQAFRKSYVLR